MVVIKSIHKGWYVLLVGMVGVLALSIYITRHYMLILSFFEILIVHSFQNFIFQCWYTRPFLYLFFVIFCKILLWSKMPRCNLANLEHTTYLQHPCNKMTCLYEATIEDMIWAFMQIAYYSWLKEWLFGGRALLCIIEAQSCNSY